MDTYSLYLESGPRRQKTMVHVLDLLGCIAVGRTTEAALDATPDAIRTFRGFLHRHGEPIDPDAAIETVVAEHITQGQWLGNGSPYLVFGPDLEPVTAQEMETFLARFGWMTEELADWASRQSGARLDAKPEGGRNARAILLHVLGPVGGYLSAALGGAPGFSAIAGAAERGDLPLPEALRRMAAMASERVRAATPEERAAVRERAGGDHRTLRRGLRRMLEHEWEHLAELSRRPGGPPL